MTEADMAALAEARARVGGLTGPVRSSRTETRPPRQAMYDLIRHRQVIARLVTGYETPVATVEPQPHTIFACGQAACRRTITVMTDGNQVRQRQGVDIDTLRAQAQDTGIDFIPVECNRHGGLKFPDTTQIRQSLGLPPVAQPLPGAEG